ncbi:hypothetical protein BIW11_08912 [Tropilaelaps mercedesae]|uniref:MARVEL domain-containing protein n=1 Tax=Tropilaelaps mercedesae TaxID=418985 RepID=A0A1V9XMI8_9ACAR|nr:hypothetical protein BIW11_08912 [Tropilaelaps mercedesae]
MEPGGDCNVNISYLCTVNGWFKVIQTIFNLVVLLNLALWEYGCNYKWSLFMQMIGFTFFLMTAMLLTTILLSPSAQSFIGTFIYINYHLLAVVLYLCGSISLFVMVQVRDSFVIVAGVMGLLAAGVYGADVLFAFKGRC